MAFYGIKYYQIKKRRRQLWLKTNHILSNLDGRRNKESAIRESEEIFGFFCRKKEERLKGINIFFHGYHKRIINFKGYAIAVANALRMTHDA